MARCTTVNLNGRCFELSAEACQKIPLLHKILNMTNAKRLSRWEDLFASEVQTATGKPSTNAVEEMMSQIFSSETSPSKVAEAGEGKSHGEALAAPAVVPDNKRVVYFTRSAAVFEAIMDYVENGELHVPSNLCPNLVVRDLAFWGFSLDVVEVCCLSSILRFLNDQEKLAQFRTSTQGGNRVGDASPEVKGRIQRLRAGAWRFIDDPNSSFVAKGYFFLMLCAILSSFFVMAAQTHEYFHQSLSTEDWKTYLGSRFYAFYQYLPQAVGESPASSSISEMSHNDTVELPWKDRPPRAIVSWLVLLNYTTLAVLGVDFLLRAVFCPGLRYFCTDVITIADTIALSASIVKCVIDGVAPEHRFHSSVLDAINVLQLLRILRFLRPMSKILGFRVLYFTLKSSGQELLLLLGLVLFLVMVFASLLYYADNQTTIKSIPDAMWYALVTMTTVGYGDIVPNAIQTKIIGAACAVVGVGVISMTMPVIVGSFLDFYNHSIILAFSSKQKKRKEPTRCVTSS